MKSTEHTSPSLDPSQDPNARLAHTRRSIRDLLLELDPAPHAKAIESLSSTVHRIALSAERPPDSLIVKELPMRNAHLERTLLGQWLPEACLETMAPRFLAARSEGASMMHAYEDLRGHTSLLAALRCGKGAIRATVGGLARLHSCFAGKPVLAECRLLGRELGSGFFLNSVRDALRCLESVPDSSTSRRRELLDRIRRRLDRVDREKDWRGESIEECGGPETLLHGDPTVENVFVKQTGKDFQVKFIDWDHAGIGPAAFDLWTFAAEFPVEQRRMISDAYFDAAKQLAWRRPSVPQLATLFETIELGRLANRVIWPALSLTRGAAEWAWDDLERVDRWFDDLEASQAEVAR